jgi:hypothetical protein
MTNNGKSRQVLSSAHVDWSLFDWSNTHPPELERQEKSIDHGRHALNSDVASIELVTHLQLWHTQQDKRQAYYYSNDLAMIHTKCHLFLSFEQIITDGFVYHSIPMFFHENFSWLQKNVILLITYRSHLSHPDWFIINRLWIILCLCLYLCARVQ